MTIELTEDERQGITFALGIAAGAYARDQYKPGIRRVFLLANAINRNNPQWIPYEIPEG
jgi:hypothetical protein